MIRPGDVDMVCGNAYMNFMFLHSLGLLYPSHGKKPMSFGGPVHTYRTRSQVEGPLHVCPVHMYSSCSLWAMTVD